METLVAFPVLFLVFNCLFMFGHLCAGQLVVQRAASAAARAAVVFLPDDPEYYGRDGMATKEECVKQAARQVLLASKHFKLDDKSLEVRILGSKKGFDPLEVSVIAQYDCSSFLGALLCGGDRAARISSSAVLAYQEGMVEK